MQTTSRVPSAAVTCAEQRMRAHHARARTPCAQARFRTVSRADRSAAPSASDSAPCSVHVRRPACSETAVHPLDASHALAHHSARPARACTYDAAYHTLSTHSGHTAHHCRCNELHRDRARTAAKARCGTPSTYSRSRECSQRVLGVLAVHAETGPALLYSQYPKCARLGGSSVSDGTTQTARDLPCGQPKWVL